MRTSHSSSGIHVIWCFGAGYIILPSISTTSTEGDIHDTCYYIHIYCIFTTAMIFEWLFFTDIFCDFVKPDTRMIPHTRCLLVHSHWQTISNPVTTSYVQLMNKYVRLYPPNTWRSNNVVITSKRCHFDVITSKLGRFDVITTSLLRNVSAG